MKNTRDLTGVYTNVQELLQLRQLAQGLTLRARKDSRAIADGNVKTRYRGRGMEFAEVRPYQAGDDIRTIDWRVTARMQAPYTKLFQEEHERPVFLLVDQRPAMFFGSQTVFKSVFAAQLAATVAWIAQTNNDRVGALVFGENQQHDIRPRRGKHAVLDLIHQTVKINHTLKLPSNIADHSLESMLQDTARVAKPGAMVVIISDFAGMSHECRQPLSHIGKNSDVLAVHVYDALEQSLPSKGLLAVSDTRSKLMVNTRELGPSYQTAFNLQQQELKDTLLGLGIQYVDACLTQDIDTFVRDVFDRKHGSFNRRRIA